MLMAGFIKTLFSLSISGTFLVFILLLFKPLYKNRFSQKWQYYIWLVVIARMLVPFTITTDFNIIETVYRQVSSVFTQTLAESSTTNIENNLPENGKTDISNKGNTNNTDNPEIINTATNTKNTITNNQHPAKKVAGQIFLFARKNIFYIWLIIAIAIFTRKITAYQSFTRYLKSGWHETSSLALWEEMGDLIEKSHIRTNINLYTNSLVSSPLLTGFFRPCIIIPSEGLDKTDFKNIICHELIHFKRKDMFYKWLIQLTACIHWFNPFVYLVARETSRLCELSCDEMVIKNLDMQGKKEYGNTLLNMAGTSKSFKNSIASVTLHESKKLLKERLDKIMEFKKKTKTCTVLSVALALTLCITAATAASTDLTRPSGSTQEINNTNNNPNNNSIRSAAKTGNTGKSNNNSGKYNAINKLIERNRVILDDGTYHILCDGVKKEDMSSASISDGCIGITLEQADGGYVSIGPVDIEKDLDGLVKYVKKTCNKYVKNKTMTQEDAELMIGLAIKLEAGHGKIDGIKDISAKAANAREYKKWNIKYKKGSYYYKNQRVRIFVDLKADKSFNEFSYDYKGTIDLKIMRNKKDKITKIKLISKKEADKFLEG